MTTAGKKFQAIRNLADIRAIEDTPLKARKIPPTPLSVIRRSAELYGARIALQYIADAAPDAPEFSLSYQGLYEKACQAAAMFSRFGIGPADPVTMLLPNLPHVHYVLWGAQAVGIVNPVNPHLEPAQIAAIMREAGTKILVTTAPEAWPDLWDKVVEVARRVPSLQTVLVVDERRLFSTSSENCPGDVEGIAVHDFDKALLPFASSPPDRSASEITAYFHTGGTTGTPKLSQWAGANQCYMAWATTRIGCFSSSSVGLCGMPLFHASAAMVTGLAAFFAGARVVIATPHGCRNAAVIENFWKLIERFRVSYFNGVPTIYADLLDVPREDADIRSLEVAFCGAAPMPVELFRRVESELNLSLLEGYGLTEVTTIATANPFDGKRRIGSIGLRIPYTRVKAVVLDDLGTCVRDCRTGESGVLLIRGPGVFAGYRDTGQNKAAFAAPGWLNSGDIGYQDPDGYFWLSGRAKDLIIRGGHNIDPAVIEEAMAKHPAVDLVAAVGLPDTRAGELPMVFVTLRKGTEITMEALENHARNTIPERAAIPVRVKQIDIMPLTAVGKIFKPNLRARAASLAARAALQKAGIVARVGARHDLKAGTVVKVSLAHGSDTAAAKLSLGQFAFRVNWTQ